MCSAPLLELVVIFQLARNSLRIDIVVESINGSCESVAIVDHLLLGRMVSDSITLLALSESHVQVAALAFAWVVTHGCDANLSVSGTALPDLNLQRKLGWDSGTWDRVLTRGHVTP